MNDITEFEKELEKYGLDIDTYDSVLNDVSDKMSGMKDVDWSEIVSKHNIKCANDTLRKASQTIFGGFFVGEYIKAKNKTASTKLSQARDIVGEQMLLKTQLQIENRSINKFKREFVKSISIAEELAEIQEANGRIVNVPLSCCQPIINDSQYEMICHITDFHIGCTIENCKGNKFNWEIANKRIDQYIAECYKYIKLYNIKKVYVINTGDEIEHVSMRKNQSQFCEFNQAQQVNKAIEIIFRFLCALCEKCDVEYDSVCGNHDRTNGDLSANLDGDNADTIIKEQLARDGKLAKMSRLTVVDRSYLDNEIVKEVNGILIKARHGNKAIKDDKAQLKADISIDEKFYDLLLKGHEHNFRCVSENRGRYVVSTGCLSGYNDYSKTFGCATEASQTLIIVDEGRVELVKDVRLN